MGGIMNNNYLDLVYILEIMVLFFLVIQSWKVEYVNRRLKLNFIGILISIIVWCFSVFMVTISDSMASIWFWHEFKFLGIAVLPSFFLLFALSYAKRERYIRPIVKFILFFISGIFIVLAWTNHITGLFRKHYDIVFSHGLTEITTINGPAFWALTAYTYLILMGVIMLFWIRYRELPKTYKSQPLVMLTILIIQMAINFGFVFNMLGNSHDPSSLIFGVTAVAFYLGLFHSTRPDLLPVARSLVFEKMNAILLVKDINGYIVDYNEMARQVIKTHNLNVDGLLYDHIIDQLIIRWSFEVVEEDKQTIYKLMDGSHNRYYAQKETPILYRGENNGSIITFEDISDERNYLEHIERIAKTDALTNLYNRTYFDKVVGDWPLDETLKVVVFFGGLNSFKLINESFGPLVGNEVLQNVARKLIELTPKDSFIARTGGDEFSIIIEGMSDQEADALRERIESEVNQIVVRHANVSITMAYDLYDGHQDSLAAVTSNAINKMYRKKLNESQSSRSAMINSLKIALEQSNYETKAHADRTERLALAIGKRVGLNDSQLCDLSMLSSLHDLGKIAIPDYIINKPGKLTSEEFEIIMTHPQKGYVMAIASPELVNIADGILHHHERWDGQGYPDGLKGEEISIEARIICIVDAYDVMSNVRPYKAAMTMEEAIVELKRCRGTHFDPHLVDILIDVLVNE